VAVWEQGRVNSGQFLDLGLGGPHSGMPDSVLGRMVLRGEKRGGIAPSPCPLLYSSEVGGLCTFIPAMMFWWKLGE